jgi:hypothetical protein
VKSFSVPFGKTFRAIFKTLAPFSGGAGTEAAACSVRFLLGAL